MISWNLRSRSVRPIGLDIGHDSIKMIQLVANGAQMGVIAADKVRVDPNIDGDPHLRRSFILSAIEQMLSKGGFKGRDVVSCLPNDGLKVTSLRLSELESDEVEQALTKEMNLRFGVDPYKNTMDYMFAGNVRHGDEVKNELILFAADDEIVRGHIELLEAARLKPVSIDTVPCALFRSFKRSQRRQEDRECTVVFADIGSRFTTVVFGRGDQISFVKQIRTGGEMLNREIAARLGVGVGEAEQLRVKFRRERCLSAAQSGKGGPPATEDGGGLDGDTQRAIVDAMRLVAEKLAREISLCLRYYTVTFRGKRVERAFFAGGEAYENTLVNVLRRQLTVGVEVAQPLKGFDLSTRSSHINFDSDRRGLLCEWAVAVGLSLKGWNGASVRQKRGAVL